MISSIANLPDNIEILKEIIAEREQKYQTYIKLLEEKIRLLQDKLFGRKSEKITDSKYLQLFLFNEVEDTVDKDKSPSNENDESDKSMVKSYHRKKAGRKKGKLSMPAAYGLGLAFKPSDRLIFDFDLYRMEWDDFVLTDSSGQKINPVTGLCGSIATKCFFDIGIIRSNR